MIHTQHKVFVIFQELIFSKQKKKKNTWLYFFEIIQTHLQLHFLLQVMCFSFGEEEVEVMLFGKAGH